MRALISVSDKQGIIEFASGLSKLGYEIISTGGTAEILTKHKVKVIPIEKITGFPEMMDGRVKTLHPKIHGGLLALRSNDAHMKSAKSHGIGLIDLVVVNLYPFEKAVSKKNVSLETAIENIDIGGPSMLRSASKNFESVGVIVNPDRYAALLEELQENNGELTLKTKQFLAVEAFQHTARYDALIAGFLEKKLIKTRDEEFSKVIAPVMTKFMDLRYGENPHQKAAFYRIVNDHGLPDLEQINGKELSYNNIVDLEAAWNIVKEFELPAAAIIKHTNPCGAAVAESISLAYKRAYKADSVSAFGSIVGLNRPVDEETAQEISKTFVEVVIAPNFDDKALKILKEKAALRLIKIRDFFTADSQHQIKYVRGGALVQSVDSVVMKKDQLQVVTEKKPLAKELNDLEFAFTLVKHVKSNAIVIAKNGQTLGIGAGQMSRVEAVEIALRKAGDKANGAVAGSDAFFPFKDSAELMAEAGIKAIVQPGGSKRDQESIDCCNKHGMSMVFSGIRHFRH